MISFKLICLYSIKERFLYIQGEGGSLKMFFYSSKKCLWRLFVKCTTDMRLCMDKRGKKKVAWQPLNPTKNGFPWNQQKLFKISFSSKRIASNCQKIEHAKKSIFQSITKMPICLHRIYRNPRLDKFHRRFSKELRDEKYKLEM